MAQTLLTDGLVAFVKGACPTCVLAAPAMAAVARARGDFQVVTQDGPGFPAGVTNIVDDRALDHSWLNHIESTPTLLRFSGGKEVERVAGWDRAGWQRLTGITNLGADLPAWKPG